MANRNREDNNYYLAPAPYNPRTLKPPTADEQFGWAKDAIQQSRAYLRLQAAYPFIQDSMDLISGEHMKSNNQSLSGAKTGLTERNMRELVAAQSNLRIIPAIGTESGHFREQTVLLNKSYLYWQQKTFADRIIRQAFQYAVGQGTGYLSIGYDPDHYALRRGEIVIRPHGALDVLPLGMPHDHNIQKAYCITLRIPTPYHQAVAMFPDFADKIRPTHEATKGHGTVIAQSVKFASAVLKRFGPGASQEREPMPWAMVDIYYMFIDDRTVNYTGKPIWMGDPGTSWEYRVPYVGELIPTGTDADGKTHYKQATADDCLLYPNRRMLICTDTDILNPDPTLQVNHSWHGKVPVVQFRADDWAWLYLGFPLSKAGMLLEKANIELLRGMVDMMNVRLSPPTGYDRNTMARALAETVNLRIPNQRIGLDYTLGGDQLKPLLPSDYLSVPNNIPEFMQQNEARITHQMGVADATALARARQTPAGDSVERIMEALGPIVKDESRNMEFSVTSMGDMWIPMCFQFWPAAKRFQIFGEDGEVAEDVDWNPGSMVPQREQRRLGSYFDAARQHVPNFHYSIEPYSLHEMNSITRQMKYLQLYRSGFPISWWTLAKIMDIRDFGPKPRNDQGKEYTSELELWISQKEIESRFAAAQGQPGQHQAGRKPSGQQPPALTAKAGGNQTVRESAK